MGRRSSVLSKLPVEVRTEVDRMLIQGTYADTEIVEWLQAKGHDISKSALGRYAKSLRDALGPAARHPVLAEGEGVAWLLLSEIRQLRLAVEALREEVRK